MFNRAGCIPFASVAIFVVLVHTGHGQTEWIKYSDNPVMTKDTTLEGIWEWAGIGQPSCLFEDDTIKMYYAAAGVAYIGDTIVRGRISYAASANGIDWIKRDPPTPVLDVGPAHTWDSRWLDTPAIVRDAGGYKLYYYGDSLNVGYSAIGMASSTDGINWTKNATNPVLEKGELAGWDGFWIESPAVLYDSVSGLYEMWYTGVGYGQGLPSDLRISIGRAISVDGAMWLKDTLHNPVLDIGTPGSFDDGWVSVPGVRKTGGRYEMWYVGASVADYAADSTLDTARIGYATSTDGVNWVRYAGNPVLSTFDPPVDAGGPWAPDVVLDNTAYRMLYETAGGMGLASAAIGAVQERYGEELPAMTILPNPCRGKTRIRYTIHDPRCVIENYHLAIFDVAGRVVKDLTPDLESCILNQGSAVTWYGTDDTGRKLPGGIYFVTLKKGDMSATAKCVLLR